MNTIRRRNSSSLSDTIYLCGEKWNPFWGFESDVDDETYNDNFSEDNELSCYSDFE